MENVSDKFEFGEFTFDRTDRVLFRGGDIVGLPPKTCDLLAVLVANAGRIVGKRELMEQVWPDTFVEEANLSHHIALLRREFSKTGSSDLIQTIPRKGYRFVPPLEVFRRDTVEISVLERTSTEIVDEFEISDSPDIDTRAKLPAASRGRVLIIGIPVMAVLLAGAAFVYFVGLRSKPRLQPRLVPVTAYAGDDISSAISPDGKLVAFVSNNVTNMPDPTNADPPGYFNLYVKQADSDSLLQLTNKEGRAMSPAWSPDGQQIVYAERFRGELVEKSSLYIVPSLGGSEQKLYEGYDITLATWSPDGKTIVFGAAETKGSPHRLFAITLATREVRKITDPQNGSSDTDASFSPDSRQVAFVRNNETTAEISVTALENGPERQITHDGRNIGGVAWAPDGRNLIFASNRKGTFRLWSIPLTGGEPTLVNGPGEPALDPSISADGRRITYTRMVADFNIFRVALNRRAATPPAVEKVISSTRQDRMPSVSPDGTHISFVSNQTGPARQVWIAKADGTEPRQVTEFPEGSMATRTVWSPDGTHLAFDASATGRSSIYTLDVDSGVPVRLTGESIDAIAPSWSRDGKFIYFARQADGQWQIWKIPAGGGEPIQVTKNGGYEGYESPDGRSIYYNKAGYGTIGIFRQPVDSSGEEEKVFDLLQVDSLGEWALVDNGIYYFHRADSGEVPAKQPRIRYFDLGTKQITDISPIPLQPLSNCGLSVSPDGAYIYYSINDHMDVDIMMVDDPILSE